MEPLLPLPCPVRSGDLFRMREERAEAMVQPLVSSTWNPKRSPSERCTNARKHDEYPKQS